VNRKVLLLGGAPALVLGAGLALGVLDGSPQGEDPHAESAHEHEGLDPCGEGEALPEMSLEAIAAARCEHGVPTYRCDACRYEIGMVEVTPSLLKGSAAGEGLLRTEAVLQRRVAAGLEVTGEVHLNDNTTVHLSPRIPGIIESVQVDVGARVDAGDLLFTINSVELGRTLADYERSLALAELSRKSYERERSLLERQIASEQDMIEARMEYERHRTELVATEQALGVFGLTGEDLAAFREPGAAERVGCLPVRAPRAGTIIDKHAVVGELVEPGQDVMLLADLRTVWVWADIYEQDLAQLLAAGQEGPIPVSVRIRAFPDRAFAGEVDYIGATMQERTRTVKVRATVGNPDGLLRPGMFCEIRIAAGAPEEVIAVPGTALLSDEGRDFVFTHWREGYFVRRDVRKGRQFLDAVEILAGLEPGEVVVTEGAFLLKSDVLREKMGAGCAD
jgi:cobalt-zinc-cadmium efflux system membrane fusion protein